MTESTPSSYDEVLYPSRAYKNTRPDHLAAVARIFAMEAPDFRKSNVLELGCASGGNLVPMAAAYPDSRFVGIDTSKKQIEEGQKAVSELGLANIELKGLSLTDEAELRPLLKEHVDNRLRFLADNAFLVE